MNRMLVVGGTLFEKRKELDSVSKRYQKVMKRAEEISNEIDEAETHARLNQLEKEVDSNIAQQKELTEKIAQLQKQVNELQQELAELSGKKPNSEEVLETDQRSMGKILRLREGIDTYVRSRGTNRAGVTSVSDEVLVPKEVLKPFVTPHEGLDLSKYVNVVKVNNGSGKLPVSRKTGSQMVSVAELEKNPELAKPQIDELPYTIETYRGYIPVSMEMIEDADYDVSEIIIAEINNQEVNTKNQGIIAAMKTATPKTVLGLDGIKKVINTDLKRSFQAKLFVSSSLFHVLDLMKDKNGKYILQPDIKASSGKSLFGKEVVVLDDDQIGTTEGDLVGFIGDAKKYLTLLDRKKATIKWVNHDLYGELLSGHVRFDTIKVMEEAGFYITFQPEV